MLQEYRFINKYRDDDILRKSFNDMAQETFAINFETWYRKGYWKEKFNPNSLFKGDELISNVSVNTMTFNVNGKAKNYIQLGTVMTKSKYRNQGLSRYILDKIIDEYEDKCDGIYLFANRSALGFYPKFGFEKINEYKYFKKINNVKDKEVVNIDMSCELNVEKFIEAVEKSSINSRIKSNNMEIVMFYITSFMRNSVYYIPKVNAYAVAEIDEENILLHDIYCDKQIDIDDVIEAFGREYKSVELGFTPINNEGYEVKQISDDDTTLFVLGKDFNYFNNDKIMFPTLSHA